MRIFRFTTRNRALTLLEILVVIAVIGALAAMLLPALIKMKQHDQRVRCINNSKQIGVAFRVWINDRGNTFPMSLSETNGGTMQSTSGTNLFRHFQVMSNELGTPAILICPTDSAGRRSAASNFTAFNNRNVSYFVGVISNNTNPKLFLAGDRNITNGSPLKNAALDLTTNHPSGWTAEMHNKIGDLTLADGSVQQVSNFGLRNAITNSGVATNRLQMPILGP